MLGFPLSACSLKLQFSKTAVSSKNSVAGVAQLQVAGKQSTYGSTWANDDARRYKLPLSGRCTGPPIASLRVQTYHIRL